MVGNSNANGARQKSGFYQKPDFSARPRPPLSLIIAALLILLSPLALAFTDDYWPRQLIVLALAWWLPGGLLVTLWRLPGLDLPAAAIFSLGLGWCWMVLLGMIVHWIPGPTSLELLIGVFEIGAVALLVLVLFRPRPPQLEATTPTTWLWLGAVLLAALLLRLPGLGYHEFHVDEVVLLERAAQSIAGEEDALARHTKGPGESVVTMVAYRAMAGADEATARFPFALAAVGSVLAVALLGRRLFSGAVGFWAGILFAANGFAIGLSRIVQYQPAVLLLSALAVLAAWEFSRCSARSWLVLAATLSAFGLVMHYEFGLLALALIYLAWLGWQRASDRSGILWTALGLGGAGFLLVAAAYTPMIFNPYFERTQGYLTNRVGSLATFNFPFFVEMGTFYNSIYFFVGLLLLMLAGTVWGWRHARRRTILLWLWWTPFFVLYIFIMRFPGTHFYLLMQSWSLLAALPLAVLTTARTVRPWLRWSGLGLAALWLLVSVGYLHLMFFRQNPEYLVNFDSTRVPFYWAPYGTQIPQKPRFGFPIREGWKTVGLLAEWGYLDGTFSSNERSHHVRDWYAPGLDRVDVAETPGYVFVAEHLQEPDILYDEIFVEANYTRVGEVRVRGEPRIQIWTRQPLPVPYVTFESESFEEIFDATVPRLSELIPPPAAVEHVALGGVTLDSARVDTTTLSQGDTLHLTAVWSADQPLKTDYKLFVHVVDVAGQLVTQWDGLPGLNLARSSEWRPGEPFTDHVLLPLSEEMSRGEYRVLIGLYDPVSGQRLGDQAVEVARISVR